MAFLDDIKSKHLSNFVLVTIGDGSVELGTCYIEELGDGVWENKTQLECLEQISNSGLDGTWESYGDTMHHRISTQKITFDGKYYKPILLNIPSISESLDIEQRKYKISSVSLSISDYLEDGERFSDNLNTLMNKEVNIYYASQSCSTLDDCYKAGTYIVRSFSQDEDKVTLNCEDLSQDKLQTEIPLQELGDDESILEKYRNKPIPMVFGEVDRSPCVLKSKKIIFDTPDSTELAGIELDDIFTDKIKESLYIFDGDSSYSNVLKNIEKVLPKEGFSYVLNEIQWSSDDSSNGYVNLLNTKLSALNNLQVRRFSKSENPSLTREHLPVGMINQNNLIAGSGNAEETIDNNFNTYVLVQDHYGVASDGSGGIIDGDFNPSTLELFKYYKMVIPLILASDTDRNDIPEVALNRIRLPKPFPHLSEETDPESGFNSTFFETNYYNTNIVIAGGDNEGSENNISDFVDNIHEHPDTGLDYSSLFIFNEGDIGTSEGENSLGGAWEGQGTDIGFKDQSFYNSSAAVGCFANDSQFELIFFAKLPSTSLTSSQTYQADLIARIREIDTTFIADIKEPLKKNYFIHVIGRAGEAPSSQSIYTEILSELDFEQQLEPLGDIELGKYAFTIDKKINSKKLIEELSQSTPLYPYFKDGQFRVKSIKKTYTYGDSISIDVNDVIKYKYDRTKIEKVYNRVNVKYHYDYGLKDFTKETGDVTPAISGVTGDYLTNNNENYFGADFDQELVFESKYIRDEATAQNLAKYLCGLHANQHNIIHLTLPLNYLTLELGDIVRLDELIQGRKIFGEDYSSISESDNAYARNGQNIYKFWFVEQIKKSLDKVEVKLYQLHEFYFSPDVVDIIDPPEEEEEPEEPTSIQICFLPNYQNSYSDADGNFYDINDSSLSFSHNFDLCGEPIQEEEEEEPVGYCLIDNNSEHGSTESECTQQGGEWSNIPIVFGCSDLDALNTSPYYTHADDNLCVYPQELLSPEITSPEENLVISTEGGESGEGLGDNIVTSNDSTFDDNTAEGVTITGVIINQSWSGAYTFSYNELYGVYPDNFFIGGTITNLTTGESGVITDFNNLAYNQSISFGTNIDFEFGGTEYTATSLYGQNYSNLKASNEARFLVYGHSGTLRLELIDPNSTQAGYNNGGIKIRSENNPWLNDILPNTTYRISLDVRAISHDSYTTFRIFGFGNMSPYFSITSSWQTYEHDFIGLGGNTMLMALSNANYGEIFEIDNFLIRPIIEVTEPVLTVSWNKSPNLIETYDELGITTAGEYLFVIYGIIDNNYTQFYSAEPIAATGQNSYSQIIYLNDTNIPQNIPLSLLVTARSTYTYNGNYLFNPTFGFPQPTTITERSFSWGELDEENIYDVANIVEIIYYILGQGELTEEQFTLADIDANGVVDITDVINIIQQILYG